MLIVAEAPSVRFETEACASLLESSVQSLGAELPAEAGWAVRLSSGWRLAVERPDHSVALRRNFAAETACGEVVQASALILERFFHALPGAKRAARPSRSDSTDAGATGATGATTAAETTGSTAASTATGPGVAAPSAANTATGLGVAATSAANTATGLGVATPSAANTATGLGVAAPSAANTVRSTATRAASTATGPGVAAPSAAHTAIVHAATNAGSTATSAGNTATGVGSAATIAANAATGPGSAATSAGGTSTDAGSTATGSTATGDATDSATSKNQRIVTAGAFAIAPLINVGTSDAISGGGAVTAHLEFANVWRLALRFATAAPRAQTVIVSDENRGTVTGRPIWVSVQGQRCSSTRFRVCGGVDLGARLIIASAAGNRLYRTGTALTAAPTAGLVFGSDIIIWHGLTIGAQLVARLPLLSTRVTVDGASSLDFGNTFEVTGALSAGWTFQ